MDWTTHVFLIKPGIVLHEGAFDVQVSNDDRFAMLATRSIPFNSKRLTSGEMALALSIGRLVESNVKLSSYFTRLFLLTIRLPEIGVTYLNKPSKCSAIREV